MPHSRFFLNDPLIEEARVSLIQEELHHLRVMRTQIDEIVELVNGQGVLAQAKLLESHPQQASLLILSRKVFPPFSPQLILAIPWMRKNKIEWSLEKSMELGADQFWIYRAQFSEKEQMGEKEILRWRALLISSLKQSGRLYLPKIELFSSLNEMVSHPQCPPIVYGDVIEKNPFQAEKKDTLFISGPEKGFSQDEKTILTKRGKAISLSPFTLRAETAPIAFTAIFRNQTFQKQ